MRKDGLNNLQKAAQTIHDGDQNVILTSVLQLVEYLEPELGTLGMLDPDGDGRGDWILKSRATQQRGDAAPSAAPK